MHICDYKFKTLDDLSPIILVSGEDYFLINWFKEKVISLFPQGVNDIDFTIVDENANLKDVVFECGNLSFTGGKRVVLLPNRVKKLREDERKVWNDYLKNPNERVILLIIDTNKVFSLYKKKTLFLDAKRMDRRKIEKSILVMANNYGVEIEKSAINKLIDYTNSFMTKINIEMQKLAFYVKGDTNTITTREIDELTAPEVDFQIYELINSASRGDWDKTLEIKDTILKAGTPPIVLIISLCRQFRRLLYVSIAKNISVDELSNLLGVKPFAIKKDREITSRFSQMKLKKIKEYLYDAEYSFKIGKMTELEALENSLIYILTVVNNV